MSFSACPVILPISDLRTNLNHICDLAEELSEPLVMTKNGKPALVVMSSAAYEEKILHDRMVLKVREAEIEAQYKPDPIPLEDFDKRMVTLLDRFE